MQGSAREPLGTVAVVGDGPTGLAAAIALRRALPRCAITVIPAPADPAALADRTAALTPRSNAFLRQIGIHEEALVVRAGASHRLGTELLGWTGGETRAVHPFGAAPPPDVEGTAVSAALALADRFAHPSDDPASPLSDIDYALRLNPQAYTRLLGALAVHLGIVRCPAGFAAAACDASGSIARIRLTDGEDVTADLFIDCSGPAALVASALLPEPRVDWSLHLPVDRLLFPLDAAAPRITGLDSIAATSLGWRTEVRGRDVTHTVFATNSAAGSPEAWAAAAGFAEAAVIPISPGRRNRVWQANVICLGDAAAQFEPLHWLNAGLAHAQIALLIELLPGRDLHPLERDEFNRRAAAMADRVCDFLALHYRAPRLSEGPFWALASGLATSDGLRLTIEEFTRRGRLPFFEEDILPRDAWLFAMATLGIRPGPTARSMTLDAARRTALIRGHEARAKAAVQSAVPYREWLAAYLQSAQ
jgi:tryptophan halogenase